MRALIKQHLPDIQRICKIRHVANLYAFGSVLTDKFRADSDIDFLVEFEDLIPEDYADNYFDLCDDLEQLFQRKIDLVTLRSVKNPYFKNQVMKTRELIYVA